MPEVVKAETHLFPFLDHSGLHRRRPRVLLHHDGRGQWLLALEPDAREHEVRVLAKRRLVAPSEKKPGKERMHGNRGLRCLRLRHFEPSPHHTPVSPTSRDPRSPDPSTSGPATPTLAAPVPHRSRRACASAPECCGESRTPASAACGPPRIRWPFVGATTSWDRLPVAA